MFSWVKSDCVWCLWSILMIPLFGFAVNKFLNVSHVSMIPRSLSVMKCPLVDTVSPFSSLATCFPLHSGTGTRTVHSSMFKRIPMCTEARVEVNYGIKAELLGLMALHRELH